MKVAELIYLLNKENPDLEVIIQKDPEGNGYHHLNYVEEAKSCEDWLHDGEGVLPSGLTVDELRRDWLMEPEEYVELNTYLILAP